MSLFGYAVPLRLIIAVLIVSAAFGWIARVDHLRAHYKGLLTEIQTEVQTRTGKKFGFSKLRAAIIDIDVQRAAAKADLGEANRRIEEQNGSIEALNRETVRLRGLSDAAQAQARKLIAERDQWIAAAQSASTRTERLSAEWEVEECNAALDDLYNAGF